MSPEPPTPAGLPLVGHTIAYASDRFGFVSAAREECGDVFVVDVLGLGEVCYLTHPDHFEQALVTEREAFGKSDLLRLALGDGLLAVDGVQWERQREALEEWFSPGRVRSYAAEIVRLTERRIDRWSDGDRLSLLEEMASLGLEILFGTLFDCRLEPDRRRTLRRAADDLNAYFAPTSLAFPRWLPTPARRRFDRADRTLRSELRSMVDERVAADDPGHDLLSTLARWHADGTATMSKREVIDQLLTFLFAGHETTALAMTYALYEVGACPSVRERLHRELDGVLDGSRPTVAALGDLAVTERVVTETVRLYPPAHTIPRTTTRDVTVGGYDVPAGVPTFLALHSVHRDDRFYDDPLAFRPERWRDQRPATKGFAYVPFGAGPRTCIGRRFALLEARLVLATIAQRYHLEPTEPLELAPLMSTQPVGDVPVTVRAR
jgi:cytochrome P450